MDNPYLKMVAAYARAMREGRCSTLGGFADVPRPAKAPDAPKALLFSPHPDDECITGALPLRLLCETEMRVINVAVTQGSRKDRQAGRWTELTHACRYLGFELMESVPNGLESVSPKGRAANPAAWAKAVKTIAAILHRERPAVVFFPHERDWNGTHIGTHLLVTEAMRSLGPAFSTLVVETEFWAAMETPNLMVESGEPDVADLVTALSFHVEEVRRNPYHLTLPAWMQDNVRRGGELVGGQGGAAPDFIFATLYRLRQWADGGWKNVLEKGRQIGKDAVADVRALEGPRVQGSAFAKKATADTSGFRPEPM